MVFCFMNLGIWEILLVALVVLLLFGGKKIPELMRGLGKGVRSFKDGVNGIGDEQQIADGNKCVQINTHSTTIGDEQQNANGNKDNLSGKEDGRQAKG